MKFKRLAAAVMAATMCGSLFVGYYKLNINF